MLQCGVPHGCMRCFLDRIARGIVSTPSLGVNLVLISEGSRLNMAPVAGLIQKDQVYSPDGMFLLKNPGYDGFTFAEFKDCRARYARIWIGTERLSYMTRFANCLTRFATDIVSDWVILRP